MPALRAGVNLRRMDSSETTPGAALSVPEPAGHFADVPARPLLALGLAVWAIAFPLVVLMLDPVGSHVRPIPFSLEASLDGATKEPSVLTLLATRAMVGLLVAGAAVSLVLVLTCMAFPETRQRLQLRRVAERPAPAIRFADLLFVILAMRILAPVLAGLYLGARGQRIEAGEQVLIALGFQLPFYVLAIFVLVTMARMRGGAQGAAGIWPFWRTADLPYRPVRDVALGLGGFALCFWILVGLSLANKYVLSLLGVGPDQNPIVDVLDSQMKGALRYWVAAGVAFTAVVMAPIAEEVLFRGLLYNFLRRHLDRWTAACASALLFSFVHGVLADQWALFVLGLLLTWVYERTGRLLPGVILHATNNGVAISYLLIQQLS